MANLQEKLFWEPGIYQLETSDPVLAGPDGIDNLQGKQLANRTVYLKDQVEQLASGKQPAGNAAKLSAVRKIEATGDGSWNVMFDGSRDVSGQLTLRDSGVAPGSYGMVTVDGKGRVTAGRQMTGDDVPAHDWNKISTGKPTTLAGYGIGDGASKTDLQTAVNGLIASAPANLNTLQELAAAVNNDSKFSATLDGKLADKADKATTLAGYGITDAVTVAMLPRKNLLQDSGRFCDPLETYGNPLTKPFLIPSWNKYATEVSNSYKYIYDNSSYGGAGGAVDPTIQDLLKAMKRSDADARYGNEFYVADFKCKSSTYGQIQQDGRAMGISTAIGVSTDGIVTFMFWIRCQSGSIMLDVATHMNGKPFSNRRITPADGWVHLAGISNWNRGYSICHLRAEDNSNYQIALPAALSGVHLGYLHVSPISF